MSIAVTSRGMSFPSSRRAPAPMDRCWVLPGGGTVGHTPWAAPGPEQLQAQAQSKLDVFPVSKLGYLLFWADIPHGSLPKKC